MVGEKGRGMLGWGPSVCVTVKKFVPQKKNQTKKLGQGPYGLRTKMRESHPPAPMNHAKIFKGWPHQDASWELVPRWYKSFQPDRFLGTNHFQKADFCLGGKWRSQLCWVIKEVLHDLVRRTRFWRIKSSEQDFKYLYWTISKTLFWNIFTSKWI